jgi:hypothetical protein
MEADASVTFLPVRQVFVEGDHEKFQAHHWMKDGYTGGIKEFTARYDLSDGTAVAAAGHALIDQNDLGAELSLHKDGLGFVELDFSEFRKYYDGTGGVYHRFITLSGSETDKELALDLGKLSVESALTLEGWPSLILRYEREYKDGAKSRLTWTPVTEGSTTRYIGPAWQDIDEIVDVFSLDAAHELAGFALTGQQRWEFVRAELFREERSLSTNSTASQKKIRRQDQAPESTLMTTTLGAERWFLNDTAFFSTAYHFAHLNNREFESLLEFNENGVLTAFSNAKVQINARADNAYDSHTWVGHLQLTPWKPLTIGTKLKSELIRKEGNSSYPADDGEASATGGTPDGIIDRIDVSLTDTKAVRWGEALSVQFTGLPRTALYTELELEQSRVLLREDRKSQDGPDTGDGTSANEVFNRETVTDVRRGVWTLGTQVAPWRVLHVTAHVRRRINHNDYDDQRESAPGSSTARSAFIDGQSVHTDEFMTRATLRPCRWFRSSLRYQFRDDDFATRAENEPLVKTGMTSHSYTYDVMLQPVRDLTATTSFSRQAATVKTPAAGPITATTPAFNADIDTWLLSTTYTPVSRVSWTGTLQYSRARNFNDFTASGLPLGSDYDQVDATTKIVWAVKEHLSLSAEYALYHYQANSNAEAGDYDAHVIWLETSLTF